MRWETCAALVLCLDAAAAAAQQAGSPNPPSRAEVLVVGVYHMANPGHDIFNSQADDVLAPRRQTEMAQVAAALKKFQPTKIAVERNAGDKPIARDYADYLAGKHELTRNEIEQLGFRVAKELGHKAVYPVDADGDFPYPRLVKYMKAVGRSNELDAVMSVFGTGSKEQDQFLKSHTILETLLYMNDDENTARSLGAYYELAHFGEPYDWAGADLVSDWYRRNMRIFTNIVQLVDAKNERILVIYGAGHLGWLQQSIAGDPTLRLRKLAEFAK